MTDANSSAPLFAYAAQAERVSYGNFHEPLRRPRGPQRWRLAAAGAIFATAFAVVAGNLMLNAAPRTVSPAIAASLPEGGGREFTPRASIVDRNGELLAYSLPFASLYANPQEVRDATAVVDQLQQLLPSLDRQRVMAALANQNREFAYLARHVTPSQHAAVLDLGIPGLYFRKEYRRIYPQGSLTAHAVGVVQEDHRDGLSGIEAFLDPELVSAPEIPQDLSIDLRVQHVVREEVQRAIDKFDAIGGLGVMMDVTTGEILASVSLPDFDPNRLDTLTDESRINKVVGGRYELGSMFKLITAAAALDTGTASEVTQFDATHSLRVYGHRIADFRGENRWLTLREVLVHSSNIGAARMAEQVGTDTLVGYFDKFGLLGKAAVELNESAGPLLPKRWHDINAMTASFGHGISVTPVQFAAAAGALVNGGYLRRPTLFQMPPGSMTESARVISDQTSARMRRLMRAVVVEGSGKAANSRFYQVGGKTGTALKAEAGGYSDEKRLSSFVGAFPMDKPRYVVLVTVDEPKGRKDTLGFATGGWVAAPAVGQIVDRTGPMLGIPKSKPGADKAKGLQTVAVRVER